MRKIFGFITTILILLSSCTKQEIDVVRTDDGEAPEITGGRQCAANEVLEKQIAADPARGKYLDDLELKIQNFKDKNIANRSNVTLYVGVVVHVVHTNRDIVTDAQIASQIAVLNKDYGKTNTELSNQNIYLAGYSLANVANCKIQFVLKQTIRVQTSTTSFGTNDAVKKTSLGGSDPINPTTQLNIWVCDLGSGLLGYAQFPGGNSATDGVVLDYQGFGTTSTGYSLYAAYNLGRSATHEIGHWFNLRHIWGDKRCGNDFVDDTPLHDGANYGCPSNTTRSKCSGKPYEQWMNYMDYTDDRCMYMFSAGQKVRMDATIDAARAAYVSTTP
ncbi:MAG: zinc metalloprotease [Ferruginibacter sp.]